MAVIELYVNQLQDILQHLQLHDNDHNDELYFLSTDISSSKVLM